MKWIDAKGRLFGKLNIFDFLVALVVVVGIAGMVTRLLIPRLAQVEEKAATYQFEVVGVQEFCINAFHIGDTVYEKGTAMGTIESVHVTPYQTTKVLEDGSYQLVDHVLYYNIQVTVVTQQLREKDGYYIGNQEILNGTTHTLSNGFIAAEGIIRQLLVDH